MQWFNEEHQRPLYGSSFKNTVLTTGHDLSDHKPLNLLESNLYGMYVQYVKKKGNLELKMHRELFVLNKVFS